MRERVNSIRPGITGGGPRPIDGTIIFPPVDPTRILQPHRNALILSLEIGDFDVRCILVDPGSSADLVQASVISHMGHSLTGLENPRRILSEFNGAYDGDPMSDPHTYRSTVGALQYLTLTRSDITFVVNKASQFMHNPTTLHWKGVKRILRYLNGTIYHGLRLTSASSLPLLAYIDADWTSNPDDRNSMSGYAIYLGPNLIS